MEGSVACPNCGSAGCAVSREMVRPKMPPLSGALCALAVLVTLYVGFERMSRPYTTPSEHGVAVALMALGVAAAVAVPAVYARLARKRPCRVLRCPRCGHAAALDEPPGFSRGWRLR